MELPLLLALFVFAPVAPFKFLCVSPRNANSHVNFQARITDALVDAGHEVVMLSAMVDPSIPVGTKKARVISVPQSPAMADMLDEFNRDGGTISDAWMMQSGWELIRSFQPFVDGNIQQCNYTLQIPGLIESLRAEKFDAAYAEAMDHCSFGLFKLLGIEKYAIAQSFAVNDDDFAWTGVPGNPAYVPSMMSDKHGDQMTFWQRLRNTLIRYDSGRTWGGVTAVKYDEIFRQFDPNFPGITGVLANNSYVFMNTEPLTDFPRPVSSKVIDVGGIVVSGGHSPLNKTWSDIMDLRPQTVLLSFGTFAKAHLMPAAYKKTILKTVVKFPNTTFIWKYEKPEHRISEGIPNLIDSTWVPQNDMLRDSRLTAFITHCGQGSTTESNTAGVPLVVIPVLADQIRNAQAIKRNGLGVVLDKEDLASTGPLEDALTELLSNPVYRLQAKKMAKMLANRPFPMRKTFVRHMEFLAEYGPLRQLDHYGTQLNFVQYYLIDIFAFLATGAFLATFVVVTIILYSLRSVSRIVHIVKSKKE